MGIWSGRREYESPNWSREGQSLTYAGSRRKSVVDVDNPDRLLPRLEVDGAQERRLVVCVQQVEGDVQRRERLWTPTAEAGMRRPGA